MTEPQIGKFAGNWINSHYGTKTEELSVQFDLYGVAQSVDISALSLNVYLLVS